MDTRDRVDAALVALAAILAYTETFGLVDPRTTASELLALLTGLDVRVYLVVGGIFGIAFVTYLVLYLPQKAARTARP